MLLYISVSWNPTLKVAHHLKTKKTVCHCLIKTLSRTPLPWQLKTLHPISSLNSCYVGNTFPCLHLLLHLLWTWNSVLPHSSSQSSQIRSVSPSPDPARCWALQDSFLLLKGDPGNMTVTMRHYNRFVCISKQPSLTSCLLKPGTKIPVKPTN